MPQTAPQKIFATGWRSVREAGGRRLAITALLLLAALLLARFSWSLPVIDYAERTFYDLRAYYLAEKVEQEDRVVMVVYDDQTLFQLEKRSPFDRGRLAEALRQLDGMGARAIGIDMLFDQPQAEDEDLIGTLRTMRTPTYIGYTTTDANALDIQWEQQNSLEDFVARLEGGTTGIASVMVENDDDQIVRRWAPIDPDLPPILGRAMLIGAGDEERTFPGYEGAIRYRMPAISDTQVIPRFQIQNFYDPTLLAIPGYIEEIGQSIEGRYVLIGPDVVDYDRIYTPFSPFVDSSTEEGGRSRRPPGVEMHAEMIAQMLDGARLTQPSTWFLWSLAILTVVTATLTGLLELRNWKFVPLLVAQLALFAGLPAILHARGVDSLSVPAVGPVLGWILAFTAVVSAARSSGAVQRRFAQGALGKYLPRSIADEIIEHPQLLGLGGEKREIYVLFSDLEGFTKMSHAIAPEMVAKLLNRYLAMLSNVVLEHGGILDKFIGDAVVAFWGAPIARPDDAERAAKCGYAIWQAGEDFRAEVAAMDPTLPPIGKTRVGLHFGEAVVGNFGGENRIQYTALGDSMNTAARMESGNKAFGSSIMATGDFARRTDLAWWRPMGRVVLSGRARPVDLFEPAPDFSEADRAALAEAVALLDTDRADGIAGIDTIAAAHPDDTALQALAARSRDLNEAGAYVLGSK